MPPIRDLRRAARTHGVSQLPTLAFRRAVRAIRNSSTGPDAYLDLAGHGADPIEGVYLADGRIPVVDVPLSSFRWSHLGLDLAAESNPFVRTAADYLAGRATSWEGSALQQHYQAWRPASAGAVLGFRASQTSQPPEAAVAPWSAAARRGHQAGVTGDHHRIGLAKFFGPVPHEFGEAEHARYVQVARSISQHGFVPAMGGYIQVRLLVNDGEWVAQLRSGAHRLAAVAALGIDPVKVAVHAAPQLVHREDALAWPGVSSGLHDRKEAEAFFDRVMLGDGPPGFPGPSSQHEPGHGQRRN